MESGAKTTLDSAEGLPVLSQTPEHRPRGRQREKETEAVMATWLRSQATQKATRTLGLGEQSGKQHFG